MQSCNMNQSFVFKMLTESIRGSIENNKLKALVGYINMRLNILDFRRIETDLNITVSIRFGLFIKHKYTLSLATQWLGRGIGLTIGENHRNLPI